MRACRSGLVAMALLFGACEQGDARVDGAKALSRSLVATRTLFATWQDDPDQAQDAMLEFVKSPVAAAAMMAVPLELDMAPSRLREGFPGCIQVDKLDGDKLGCEHANTLEGGCTAGDFRLEGNGTRSCDSCPIEGTDPACEYRWDVTVTFAFDSGPLRDGVLTTQTELAPGDVPPGPGELGGVVIGPGSLDVNVRFGFDFTTSDGRSHHGTLGVQSCGALRFDPACDDGSTPVAGSIIARSLGAGSIAGASIPANACVHVQFNGCDPDDWTINSNCAC